MRERERERERERDRDRDTDTDRQTDRVNEGKIEIEIYWGMHIFHLHTVYMYVCMVCVPEIDR